MKEYLSLQKETKKSLFKGIEGLKSKDLDWKAVKKSSSMGELLLHMSAFQFLVVSSVIKRNGGKVNVKLWKNLKSGFSRETGFEKTQNKPLSFYKEISAEVDALTRYAVDSFPTYTKINLEDCKKLVEELKINDNEAPQKYKDLFEAYHHSMLIHGGENMVYPAIINSHESYHRGQIFFQKFLKKG